MSRLTYSINMYDRDGDIFNECILIHSKQNGFILRFNNMAELQSFQNQLEVCIEQLEEEFE